MKMIWGFISGLATCSAVIYNLNDTEYQRMPPLFALDEYESCLVEEGSAYCLLQLQLYAETGNPLMRMIKEYSDHKAKHYNHSIIERGVCVRKTCGKYVSSVDTSEALTRSLEACVSAALRREYALSARVSALRYCDLHREPRAADAWDWAVLLVVAGLVIINIVGSFYDYILSKRIEKRPENGNLFLLSFSVMRNWKRLTNIETSNPELRSLQFCYGVRTILNMCTLLMHTFIIFIVFTENPHDVEKAYETPLYLMLVNGVTLSQLFLLLSGFLTVYNFQLGEQNKYAITAWDIPKIILLRLSRLMPVLAMTLALATTWVRHAGSGPLWKFLITGSMVADCRNNWWRHLLFINNYSDASKFCLMATWQIAAEVQVFLVGVTAYILTRGRARRALLAVLLMLSAAAPALHFILQDMDTIVAAPEQLRTMESDTFWRQHVPGHTNLPSFIIGMAVAAQLYAWQKKGGHLVNHKKYSFLQYLAISVLFSALYSGSVFYLDRPRASLLARVVYISTIRLAVALAGALVTLTLFTSTPTILKSILESRFWVVPSRLTYSVCLLHMPLASMMAGTMTQLSHFSTLNLFAAYVLVVVVSNVFAVPLCLMVEIPFQVLFKNLFIRQVSRNNKNEMSAINATPGSSGTSVHGMNKEKAL